MRGMRDFLGMASVYKEGCFLKRQELRFETSDFPLQKVDKKLLSFQNFAIG